MMNWWCEKGIDGFRMDVISLISKPEGLPDGIPGETGYADSGCANGPHVHEYLKEMNRKVLSHYDLITVGEAAGVTLEEAKKYANADGSELNMVFQFEHTGGRWRQTTGTVNGTAIRCRFRYGRRFYPDGRPDWKGKPGTVCFYPIMTSRARFPGLEMTVNSIGKFQQKCWEPVCI